MKKILKTLGIIFSIFLNVILGTVVTIFILRQEVTYDVELADISCKDKKITFTQTNGKKLIFRYPLQFGWEPSSIIIEDEMFDSSDPGSICSNTAYYIRHIKTITSNRAGYIKAVKTDLSPR